MPRSFHGYVSYKGIEVQMYGKHFINHALNIYIYKYIYWLTVYIKKACLHVN